MLGMREGSLEILEPPSFKGEKTVEAMRRHDYAFRVYAWLASFIRYHPLIVPWGFVEGV